MKQNVKCLPSWRTTLASMVIGSCIVWHAVLKIGCIQTRLRRRLVPNRGSHAVSTLMYYLERALNLSCTSFTLYALRQPAKVQERFTVAITGDLSLGLDNDTLICPQLRAILAPKCKIYGDRKRWLHGCFIVKSRLDFGAHI